MDSITCDVAVVGGGPAGLAAAIGARKAGAGKVMIVERDKRLGGILQQCIHNGFGLQAFGEDLSGPEYAERFIEEAQEGGIECLTETMVLELSPAPALLAAGARGRFLRIEPGAVVLAMGCRERPRGAIALPGHRPAGIYTAGTAQRFINMEGYLPGRKIVILGSGDIGMIMARRLHLEGATVQAVIEITECIGGLNRNLVQCIRDFNIPLYLHHAVTRLMGRKRVEGVSVAPLTNGKPDLSREFQVECDTLLLSVGLIPENELSKQAGVQLDPGTGGPLVDQHFHTSVPGIFAAGNVVMVFDLVDHVSSCGERAGRAAALYAQGKLRGWDAASARMTPGKGVRCVVPQRLSDGETVRDVDLFVRAESPAREASLRVLCPEAAPLFEKKFRIVRPPEMLPVRLKAVPMQPGVSYSVSLWGKSL